MSSFEVPAEIVEYSREVGPNRHLGGSIARLRRIARRSFEPPLPISRASAVSMRSKIPDEPRRISVSTHAYVGGTLQLGNSEGRFEADSTRGAGLAENSGNGARRPRVSDARFEMLVGAVTDYTPSIWLILRAILRVEMRVPSG